MMGIRIDQIPASMRRTERLRKKTHREIADLLRDNVWAHVALFTPLSDLLEEAIERLTKMSHINPDCCRSGNDPGKGGE